MEKRPKTKILDRLGKRRLVSEATLQEFAFQCRYPAVTSPLSVETAIQNPRKGNQAFAYGSFDAGFELALWTDEQAKSDADAEQQLTYFGTRIYVEVGWKIRSSSFTNKVKFIVDECQVDINDSQIAIIKQNCYLKTIGSRLESKKHVQSTTSSFSFNSFTTTDTVLTVFQKETIHCTIRMCLTGRCSLTPLEVCETLDVFDGLEYSFDGQ